MDVQVLAQELIASQQEGHMLAGPLSSRTGFDLEAAYAVEAALKQWKEENGHRSVGRKVGYANKAMWRVMKLETLVWGHMYEDTVHQSTNRAATLSIPHPRSLKIEPEVVIGLKDAITTQGLDAAGALAATDWIAIGFEIIDCPYPDWQFQPSDFVASFGLHAGLVIGERRGVHASAIPTLVDELARCKVRMFKNDEFVEEGAGKNSLRSPALCLAELGSAILRRSPTKPLSAGEIVSTGTLTAGHLTKQGDVWRVDVQGLDLAPLTLRIQ